MFRPESIQIQPSRRLKLAAGIVLLLICLSFLLAAWSSWWLVMIPVSLAYGGYLYWRYIHLAHPLSIVALSWDETAWFVTLRNGRRIEVTLSPRSVTAATALFLSFDTVDEPDASFKLLLIADATEAVGFRRLQVCVRQGLRRPQLLGQS